MHPDSHSHEGETTLIDNSHTHAAHTVKIDPHGGQRAEIEHRFTYHTPKTGQPERYTKIREKAKELALLIMETTPVSREQSLSFTSLEETVFWANASIARNE